MKSLKAGLGLAVLLGIGFMAKGYAGHAGPSIINGINPRSIGGLPPVIGYLEVYGAFNEEGGRITAGYIHCQYEDGQSRRSDLEVVYHSAGQVNVKLSSPVHSGLWSTTLHRVVWTSRCDAALYELGPFGVDPFGRGGKGGFIFAPTFRF